MKTQVLAWRTPSIKAQSDMKHIEITAAQQFQKWFNDILVESELRQKTRAVVTCTRRMQGQWSIINFISQMLMFRKQKADLRMKNMLIFHDTRIFPLISITSVLSQCSIPMQNSSKLKSSLIVQTTNIYRFCNWIFSVFQLN